MTRRILTSLRYCAIAIALAFTIKNAAAQLSPLKQVNLGESDDEEVVKQDPKQSFKDLFEKNNIQYASFKGINTEHLNPKAVSFVQDYIDRHADNLKDLQTWARPYFDMMDDILTQNRIPKELKYLAVIESNLKASAISWAGAVGPWQFMPETAKRLGLQITRSTDERRDYLKSTQAASKYLNYLYNIYQDWLLVIAAYNCGPGRVNSAIQKSGSNNFWDLQYYLPTESRNHVKKFIATHYIMEGQGGVTTVTHEQAMAMMTPAAIKDSDTPDGLKVQTISGRYNSKAIAKYLEMTLAEFNKLNPNLDKVLATNNTYQLKLPVNKIGLFLNKRNEMLNESIQMIINPEYRN